MGWKNVTFPCVAGRVWDEGLGGVFLSCMPDELPCWDYSARVALGCIGLEAAGEQGPSSPNPPGNIKRSGAC